MTNRSFNRNLSQYKKLEANVDLFKEYACKKNGEFFVTAIWAKDGVSYIDVRIPAALTMRNVKKHCGNKKVIIVKGAGHYDIQGESEWKVPITKDDMIKSNNRWWVVCGRTSYEFGRIKSAGRYYPKMKGNNNFKNFLFFEIIYSSIEDRSLDMWLHLNQEI